MIKYLIKYPILKRIIPSLYKKYFFFTKNYYKEITVNNIIYNLDLKHLIDRRFYFHKGYEDELFFEICKIIKNNEIDYFFDIGCCWGVYSLRLSNMFNKLSILAFDPIKKNIDRLNFSILKNSIKNIKVFHTAIGVNKGFVELGATEKYSPNYEINESNAVINEVSKINFLDNLYNFKDKTLIFKIDTEGYEFKVLSGAIKILKNNNCFLQVEVKENNFKKINSLLEGLGYRLVSINKYNKTDFFFSNLKIKEIEI